MLERKQEAKVLKEQRNPRSHVKHHGGIVRQNGDAAEGRSKKNLGNIFRETINCTDIGQQLE